MAGKFRVAVYRCDKYEKEQIKLVVQKGFESLGGLENILENKKKVCVKPNLLMPASPEQAIITHPVFIEAVIELVSLHTGSPEQIVIADSFSPVVPFTKKGMEKVYEDGGLKGVSARTGCRLNYSKEYTTVSNPNGRFIKKIEVIDAVLDSDIIINLPKFKTHNLTGITGAVKNMFGVVPGFTKVGYHLRFENISHFAGMLLDLVGLVRPAVNIMDGILGMEGDGPGRSGTPRKLGLVMVSDDALALDMVMARLIKLHQDLNPFLEACRDEKDNTQIWENIQLLGEGLSDVVIDDFVLPGTIGQKRLIQNSFISRLVTPFARNALNPYPYIDPEICDGCLTCRDVCPRKVITGDGKKIIIDYSGCIRCFCCSEMCPQGAIEPKYRFIADLILNRLGFGGRRKQANMRPGQQV